MDDKSFLVLLTNSFLGFHLFCWGCLRSHHNIHPDISLCFLPNRLNKSPKFPLRVKPQLKFRECELKPFHIYIQPASYATSRQFGSITEAHRGILCVVAANEVLVQTLPCWKSCWWVPLLSWPPSPEMHFIRVFTARMSSFEGGFPDTQLSADKQHVWSELWPHSAAVLACSLFNQELNSHLYVHFHPSSQACCQWWVFFGCFHDTSCCF